MEFWIIILERVEFVKLLNLNGYMIDTVAPVTMGELYFLILKSDFHHTYLYSHHKVAEINQPHRNPLDLN